MRTFETSGPSLSSPGSGSDASSSVSPAVSSDASSEVSSEVSSAGSSAGSASGSLSAGSCTGSSVSVSVSVSVSSEARGPPSTTSPPQLNSSSESTARTKKGSEKRFMVSLRLVGGGPLGAGSGAVGAPSASIPRAGHGGVRGASQIGNNLDRDPYLDLEPATIAVARRDLRSEQTSVLAHDREPEAAPATAPGEIGLGEAVEDPLELVLGYARPAVGDLDDQRGRLPPGSDGHPAPAVVSVDGVAAVRSTGGAAGVRPAAACSSPMGAGVVHQVGDDPFQAASVGTDPQLRWHHHLGLWQPPRDDGGQEPVHVHLGHLDVGRGVGAVETGELQQFLDQVAQAPHVPVE